MFSIMITVESTTMPKSTAPSEIRLAGVPVRDHADEGDQQRQRDVERGDQRGARVCRGRASSTSVTSSMPTSRFSSTVWVVSFTRLRAVVVGLDVHPRRQQVVLADVLDALVDALERLERVAAVAHEHDALHDVGLVVLARRCRGAARRPIATSATSRTRIGVPLLRGDHDVADVARASG